MCDDAGSVMMVALVAAMAGPSAAAVAHSDAGILLGQHHHHRVLSSAPTLNFFWDFKGVASNLIVDSVGGIVATLVDGVASDRTFFAMLVVLCLCDAARSSKTHRAHASLPTICSSCACLLASFNT